LAQAAGVGTSTLADFERGARRSHPLILQRLAEVLQEAGIRFVYGSREIGVLLQR
jgi:transcriptional regulator with XRE-family HTH domain